MMINSAPCQQVGCFHMYLFLVLISLCASWVRPRLNLPNTLIFDYPTISAVADYAVPRARLSACL